MVLLREFRDLGNHNVSVLIQDEAISRQLIDQRKSSGLDRYDEVWEGIYVMSPMANNEHQRLVTEIAAVIKTVFDWKELGQTLAGANVSDRREGWQENYRVPDVLVIRAGSHAIDCGTHWVGGPDFAIEVVGQGERVLDKLEFYARVNTTELLVIDRDPWQLTLFRRINDREMKRVAVCSIEEASEIATQVVPISFCIDFASEVLRISEVDGAVIRELVIDSI